MGKTYVKPHYIRRYGKRIRIKGHYRKTTGSLAKGRSGRKFKRLQRKVTIEYLKKGYPFSKAQQIGRATAGKIFWLKYGKKSGRWILKRER